VKHLLDLPDVKAYADLATAYGHDSPERLTRVAEQHMGVFSTVGG
jgi:hypothetical protein